LKKSSGIKLLAILLFSLALFVFLGYAMQYQNPGKYNNTINEINFGLVIWGIIPLIAGGLLYRKALKIQKEKRQDRILGGEKIDG
jgi:ACR3 family arsenite efflux pump ArsB